MPFACLACLTAFALTTPMASATALVSPTSQLIVEPAAGEAPFLAAINGAKTSIDVEMYLITDHPIEQALIAAAKRGVAVKVILDQYPYGLVGDASDAYATLTSGGVNVQYAPSRFVFDHAKTMVVDSTTAFFGSANFTYDGLNANREYDVETTEAATVAAVQSVFDADWNGTEAGQQPRSHLLLSPGSESALVSLIQGATRRLDLEEEEAPDANLTSALEAAAKRGVAVHLIEPETSSNRSGPGAYQLAQLAASGVDVSLLKDPYVHAKLIIADRSVEVGSENLSHNSLYDNREVGAIFNKPPFLSDAVAQFNSDWALSDPVSSTLPTPTPVSLLSVVEQPTAFQNQLVTLSGTVEAMDGDTAFIGEEAGGKAGGLELWLGSVNPGTLAIGDSVTVSGYIDTYNSQLEIEAVQTPTVHGPGVLPYLTTVSTGNASSYTGLLIQVVGSLTDQGGTWTVNDGSGALPVTTLKGEPPVGLTANASWTQTGVALTDGSQTRFAPVTAPAGTTFDTAKYEPQSGSLNAGTVSLQDLDTNTSQYLGMHVSIQGAVVYAVVGSNVLAEQHGYGIRIYPAPTSPKLLPGDIISASGSFAMYDGDHEIDVNSAPTVTGTTAAPQPVTIAPSGIASVNNYVYAAVKGTVSSVSGDTVTLTSPNGGSGEVYIDNKHIATPSPGSMFYATGPVDDYKGHYQLDALTGGSSSSVIGDMPEVPAAAVLPAALLGSVVWILRRKRTR